MKKLRGKDKARSRREARRAKEQMREVSTSRVSATDVMTTLGRMINVNENKGAL